MVRRVLGDKPAVLREGLGAPTDHCPVIVVCADARRATVYRCRFGTIDRVETVRVYHQVKHPLRLVASAHRDRAGMISANRHTAAPSNAASGGVRMLTEILRCIRDLGGDDAWIVLCGVRRIVAPLKQELETVAPARVLALDWLDARATDTEIIEAARTGAGTLRTTAQGQPIQTIGELVGGGRCLTS